VFGYKFPCSFVEPVRLISSFGLYMFHRNRYINSSSQLIGKKLWISVF